MRHSITLALSSFGLAASAVVLALGPHAAQAQASQAVLEEVTVTARKRAESLLGVPAAIAVFTSEEIDRSGALNLQDLTERTPGVHFHKQAGQIPGRFNTAVRFRGMDTNNFASSQQLGTVFLDGIYHSNGISSLGLDNIERVEIIKGPQSALFGRSTFGGAINFISRDPGYEHRGRLSAELAGDETYDVALSHEGPIIAEKLAFRVAARAYGTGGQYKSITDGGALGEERTQSIIGTLRAEPTDRLSIVARMHYAKDDDGPSEGIFLGNAGSNRGQGPRVTNCFDVRPEFRTKLSVAGRPLTEYFCGELPKVDLGLFSRSNTVIPADVVARMNTNPVTHDLGTPRPRTISAPVMDEVGLKRITSIASLFVDYDFGGEGADAYTFASSSAYDRMNANWIRDTEYTPAQNWFSMDPQFHESYSQEFRLTSPDSGRLKWLVGINYFDIEYVQNGNGGISAFDLGGQLNAFGLARTKYLLFAPFSTESGTTKAVFGSIGYDLTDRLNVTAELRRQEDEIGNFNPETNITLSRTFKNTLPRVTARFAATEDTNLWATYSEGNLPGFFNTDLVGQSQAVLDSVRAQVGAELFNDEESLKSYELGWKQQWADGRLYTSLVGYMLDWTNQKTRVPVAVAIGGQALALNVSANIGKTEIKGVEFESSFRTSFGLSGGFALDYTDAQFKAFTCGFVAVFSPTTNCAGNTPPRYPGVSASLNATLERPVSETWAYFVRIDGSYQGKAYTDESNLAWITPGTVVDLRGGLQKDKLRVEAFVTNLFDNDNYTAAARWSDFSTSVFAGFTANQGVALTPPQQRRFGLKVVFEY